MHCRGIEGEVMITTVAREIAKNILENKMRRIAERRGFRVEKSRRKATDAKDFSGYILTEALTNTIVMGSGPGATLVEIEIYLRSSKLPERKTPPKAKKKDLTGMMEKR
jgi:hypothetical protein